MPREERLSNAGVVSATQTHMLQVQHGGNNPQLTQGVCESSPLKGSNRRIEADGPYRGPSTTTEGPKGSQETPVELKWLEGPEVDWYKRELLKKVGTHLGSADGQAGIFRERHGCERKRYSAGCYLHVVHYSCLALLHERLLSIALSFCLYTAVHLYSSACFFLGSNVSVFLVSLMIRLYRCVVSIHVAV